MRALARGGDEELDVIVEIALSAAEIVRTVYGQAFEVEMKAPGDPVTVADRLANDHITERLAKSFPKDAVIAEESVPKDTASIAALLRHERVFFVDPLDGTRDFAAKTGEFAVMIGLAVGGRATLGVLVLPVRRETLAGRVGDGCFIEGANGERRPLRIHERSAGERVRVVVSRARPPRLIRAIQTELGGIDPIPCGSVGAKAAYVARGEADLYVHGGGGAMHWDSCGPEAIVRAAGGLFTDLDGNAIDYTRENLAIQRGMVAAPASLHKRVLDIARAEQRRHTGSR